VVTGCTELVLVEKNWHLSFLSIRCAFLSQWKNREFAGNTVGQMRKVAVISRSAIC